MAKEVKNMSSIVTRILVSWVSFITSETAEKAFFLYQAVTKLLYNRTKYKITSYAFPSASNSANLKQMKIVWKFQ